MHQILLRDIESGLIKGKGTLVLPFALDARATVPLAIIVYL